MVLDALFGTAKPRFFFDADVDSAVLGLIREAREEIILVSPYNNFWIHLRDELRDALKRDVAVWLLYRVGENERDIKWLAKEGATVLPVERLHSKLYVNETTALVTSMNLVESSAINSKEICARFDGAERDKLVEYVHKLAGRSEAPAPSTTGHCIRCGEASIVYYPEKPLCSRCFKSWNQFQDRDYPEKHCHRCGKNRRTSFARPLCTACYKEAASAK